jgi:hypothetical protein
VIVAVNAAGLGRVLGFLSKSDGENGYTWPPRTSHDAVCFQDDGSRFDIIGGAGDGNPAAPVWQGPQPERPSNVFVPLSAVPAPSGGTSPGPSPTPGAVVWAPHHTALLARWPLVITRSQAVMRRVAEQFAYSFPTEGWGVKRADPNRPQSDNVIARETPSGLWGFQLVPFAATAINLAGQRFMPVTPTDHLGGGVPSPGPSPTPTPAPTPARPYPGDEVAVPIGVMVFAQYAEKGEAPNPGMAVHVLRTGADINSGMSVEAAIAKRKTELRAQLGLPAA